MRLELTTTELKAIIEALYIDVKSGAEEKRPLYDKLVKIYESIN